MSKLTDLTANTSVDNADLLLTVDVSDTSMAATGTDKKITWSNILASIKTYTDTLYATIASLASYVPYSGATTNVDLGANTLSAQSLSANGTNGAGHVHLKHQASDATATGSSTAIFADSNGDLKEKINGGFYSTFKTSTNTADRVYTFPDATTTLLGSSSISDTAYGAGWNGDTTTAPSKNAVYDQMETRYKSGDSPSFATITTSGNIELGNASDTTVSRVSAGVVAVEGKNVALNGTGETLTTGTIELGNASDTTLSRSSAGILAVEGVVVPSISSTNTLTNKRITRRSSTTNAPGATPTTNTDNVDIQIFTGLNTAITSMTTNLSGTPSNGDMVEFIFKDDGTARAITWGASFSDSTITAPTTTVISTELRVLFQYSTIGSLNKWVCIAKA